MGFNKFGHDKIKQKTCEIVSRVEISTFEVIADMDILMKFAPASVATDLASIVLHVPGNQKAVFLCKATYKNFNSKTSLKRAKVNK